MMTTNGKLYRMLVNPIMEMKMQKMKKLKILWKKK